MLNFVLDLLFPPVCGFCDEISKEHLCKSCKEKIEKLERYKIIAYQDKYFDKHIYIYQYSGIVREALIRYKFKNKAYIYRTFVKNITKSKKICGILESYDMIIPVPIHKKRKRKRGYNQSELIAKELAKQFDLQCLNDILIKTENIDPQSKLSKKERLENIKGVYDINVRAEDPMCPIKHKKILLLDDIFTTGTTVNECSKVLMQGRAKFVDVLTIAKD